MQIYLTLLSTDLWFGKWHEEYGKCFPEHWILGFWWNALIQTLKSMSFKMTRGVICHDNEELCKIWSGTDLSFQSSHEEFDEFWPEHLKISKNLNGFILSKVYIFWTKKVQRSYLSWNWRGIQNLERNHRPQNWHKEFDKFWPEYLKVFSL